MIISVGSTNPTKIKSVKKIASQLFKEYKVKSFKASSGVTDMPLSDEEMIKGAKNRAKQALRKGDYGVGIEGGVDDTDHGMFLCAWVAVTGRKGTGLASTGKILLPNNIAAELRKGRELGPLMDELTGSNNIKQHEGTVGLLTNNLINRSKSFEHAVLKAFMKHLNSDYYG